MGHRSHPRSRYIYLVDALNPDERWHIFDVHPGWPLTGRRVPERPVSDDPDYTIDSALAADVDYVQLLASAPSLSARRRHA